MQKTVITLVVVAVALGALYYFFANKSMPAPASTGTEVRAAFACAEGKSIEAAFYNEGSRAAASPGEPPVPAGSVELALSDGRHLILPQTISASGARYANADESIVFWNKGDTAFMTEGGVTTFEGCVEMGSGPGEPVFCTMDAMQCPDGSWVGRTGQNCEFVCP